MQTELLASRKTRSKASQSWTALKGETCVNTPVDRHCLRKSFCSGFEIVACVIFGGVPLLKVDILRPLLEKYGHRLTYSANLPEIITVVLEKEREKLLSELEGVKKASVTFDGTARMGETLVAIVRFVQENFIPTQRHIRLEVLAKTLKGDELAQRLM